MPTAREEQITVNMKSHLDIYNTLTIPWWQ